MRDVAPSLLKIELTWNFAVCSDIGRTGELLGFERAAILSTRPAESIAHAAQDFGQEDDITVLTLSRPPRQP